MPLLGQDSTQSKQDCQVNNAIVEINQSFFSSFDSIYQNYLNANNKFDYIHLSIWGPYEELHRFLIDSSDTFIGFVQNNTSQQNIKIINAPSENKEALLNIEEGSFAWQCASQMGFSNTEIYLFKSNGRVKSQVFGFGGRVKNLPSHSRDLIKNIVLAIEYIDNMLPPLHK